MDAKTPIQATMLKDYRPSPFLISEVFLVIELDEEITRVHSVLRMARNPRNPEKALYLNGESLTLISCHLNQKPLTTGYTVTDKHLIIDALPDEFELAIVTEIKPQENTALSGLYRSNGLFCTQCEAEGFRRITYYLDRPDVMALFTTTIIADEKRYPHLLSNGNLVEKGHIKGKHFAKWVDPFKKPAYLFAMVAGKLDKVTDTFITKSNRSVTLAFYVEPGFSHQCQHAITSLKRAMAWDEIAYGREYDLDIYMVVAVSDFNMGAMENKGLNIFNTKYILVDPDLATDLDFQNVEAVIGHEYFHNWSGNRVTCRDWFQLSLKEGLTVFREQQFSEDMGMRVVKRIQDVRIMRTRQFAEDAGPMSHPVQPKSYIEINNFYTATVYNKGAEVIRMLFTLLGPEKFRKGMDYYFDNHDGTAATIEDFVGSHEKANGISLAQFQLWYHQSGTPTVTIAQQYDAAKQTYTLQVSQCCQPNAQQSQPQPFMIPIKIALYTPKGEPIALNSDDDIQRSDNGDFLVLSQEKQQFQFKHVPEQPIPSLLGHFSAPVKLDFPYTPDELATLMSHDTDGYNRWDAQTRYVTQIIFDVMNKKTTLLDSLTPLVNAYRVLFERNDTEPGLLALMLSIPSFGLLSQYLDKIPVQALLETRQQFLQAFSETLSNEWIALYQDMAKGRQNGFESEDIAKRSLKNVCLYYLVKSGHAQGVTLAHAQYWQAQNMTDRMGALSAVNDLTGEDREKLFHDFYARYSDQPLCVNKWFVLEASAVRQDALTRIKALMGHEKFDIQNPNNVYSLINTFALSNPACFHDAKGQGYDFLAEQVLYLNQRNPQIAARLLEALTPWKKLDSVSGHLMHQTLLKISEKSDLSEDVYEIVTKSLSAA